MKCHSESQFSVVACEILDDLSLSEIEQYAQHHSVDLILCAHNIVESESTIPHLLVEQIKVEPVELMFSLAVAYFVESRNVSHLHFLGSPWHCYCAQQLYFSGIIHTAITSGRDSALDFLTPVERYLSAYVNKLPILVSEKKEVAISIVLTHYNRSLLIQQAIESLVNQTHAFSELIIVDDCSSLVEWDALNDWLALQVFDFPYTLIRNESNNGLGKSRNRGAQAALSEYLIFMDDDDLAHPCLVEYLLLASHHVKADIYTVGHHSFSDFAENFVYDRQGVSRIYYGSDSAYLSLTYDNIGGPTSLINKCVFEALGGFHTVLGVGADDWEFYFRALGNSYILYHIPLSLFWYRDTENSMSKCVNAHSADKRNQFLSKTLSSMNITPTVDDIDYLQQEQLSKNTYCTYEKAVQAFVNSQSMPFSGVTVYCANDISFCLLNIVRRSGLGPIKRIVDGQTEKQNRRFCSYAVVSPECLSETDIVLICSVNYFHEIKISLLARGIKQIYRVVGI